MLNHVDNVYLSVRPGEKDNLSFPQLMGNGAMEIYRPVQQSIRAHYFLILYQGFHF